MVAWTLPTPVGQTATGSTEPLPTTATSSTTAEAPRRPLDIVFLQDSTGSQGPYIKSARTAINTICEKVSHSAALSRGSIRFGLIAFRDHPPQDDSYVTKNFGFTDNVETMKSNLGSLIASGGGDGPEASTAALAESLNLQWAVNAVKIVVLITDAPPHGIGETRDGFPNGSPDQNDPLSIARQMAEHGITLYVIACEPSLSEYKNAVDFYRALAQITSGRIVPLVNANQLGDYIVGTAIETIETEALIGQFEHVILEDVYGQGKPVEEVMSNIQSELNNKNVQLNALNVEDIYRPSAIADKNVNVWMAGSTLKTARGEVQELAGPRVKEKFLSTAKAARIQPRGLGAFVMRAEGDVPRGGPMAYNSLKAALTPQQVDSNQARRMVMQSLARNSTVAAGGVYTPTGVYAGKSPAIIPQEYASKKEDNGSGA